MQNVLLDSVTTIKDLGIIFDSKLTFVNHIDYICNKALKMLGFVNRHIKDFKNVSALKTLYVCLVRSQLESNTCVWSPYYQCHRDRRESVQPKFL